MKSNVTRAIVATFNFFDNVIEQVIVEVDKPCWKSAYIKSLKNVDQDHVDWINDMPEDLEEARVEFINSEMDISVVFVD